MVLTLRDTPSLRADEGFFGGFPYRDADGDGLPDPQEEILGTNPDRPDSDFDGYSDAEEVARQSNPISATEIPKPTNSKIGLVGRVQGNSLVTLSALYVENGNLLGVGYKYGLVLGGLPIYFPLNSYLNQTRISFIPAANPLDRILIIETLLPDSIVHNLGGLTVIAKHTVAADSGTKSVDALDLRSFSGTTMSISAAPPNVRDGQGVVYKPLCMPEEVPPDWTAGQLCWQLTSTVGVSGVQLIQEIEDADCEQLDTYCSPSDCEATIGDTISVTDPGALIGG